MTPTGLPDSTKSCTNATAARSLRSLSALTVPPAARQHTSDARERRYSQLDEHVGEVALNGLLADEQLRRDLAVGLADHDQAGDLALAAGQACFVGPDDRVWAG